jgi:hypothetical protein
MHTHVYLFATLAVLGCRSNDRMAEATSDTALTEEPVRQTSTTEVAKPQIPGDSIFFQLERTPCFGKCPTYVVRVRANGSAIYDGRRFVEREGMYEGLLTAEQMRSLLTRAEALGFFSLQDKYDGNVTDLPSTVIRIHTGDRDKKVVGRVGTPRAFKDLAAYADSLLNTVDWTPRAAEE